MASLQSMNIRVVLGDSSVIALEVSPHANVETLHRLIWDSTGIIPRFQWLMFRGESIEYFDQTLCQAGVEDGSTVHLVRTKIDDVECFQTALACRKEGALKAIIEQGDFDINAPVFGDLNLRMTSNDFVLMEILAGVGSDMHSFTEYGMPILYSVMTAPTSFGYSPASLEPYLQAGADPNSDHRIPMLLSWRREGQNPLLEKAITTSDPSILEELVEAGGTGLYGHQRRRRFFPPAWCDDDRCDFYFP